MDSVLNAIAVVSGIVFVLCIFIGAALKVSIDRDIQRVHLQSCVDETKRLEDEAKRLLPSWRSGVIRGYQAIETSERSEPPQGGSVLYRHFGDSGELAVIPSTGYTPFLDDDPYEHESEEYTEDVLKLPVPQLLQLDRSWITTVRK